MSRKTKSELEFITRTRRYLPLRDIHDREDLEIKMNKVFGGIGGQPSLKQINIWSDELRYERRKEKYPVVQVTKYKRRETYRKGFTRYRDTRTGRFIKYAR